MDSVAVDDKTQTKTIADDLAYDPANFMTLFEAARDHSERLKSAETHFNSVKADLESTKQETIEAWNELYRLLRMIDNKYRFEHGYKDSRLYSLMRAGERQG